jgi:hypothetical protein
VFGATREVRSETAKAKTGVSRTVGRLGGAFLLRTLRLVERVFLLKLKLYMFEPISRQTLPEDKEITLTSDLVREVVISPSANSKDAVT